MGFPEEMAARALAATGGKSTVKATEWLLSHKPDSNPTSLPSPNPNPNPNPNPSPSPSPNPNPSPPVQPKLDRFFNFQSRLSSQSPPIKAQFKADDDEPEKGTQEEEEEEEQSVQRKRPKLESSSSKRNSFFSKDEKLTPPPHQPLSERMRPRTVNDVVGQDHLLAGNSLLRSAIDCNRIPSIILWGPPGTGKTSIARAIVNSSSSSSSSSSYRFVSLSAVTSGVKDVRDAVDEAKKLKLTNNKRTILFVDEVHRFNKSQQDSFLPVIEDGSVVFIGATTENPSFHLITPLLSRCRVLTLNPLKPHHVAVLLRRAVADSVKGLARSLGTTKIEVEDEAIEFLSENCDGDARVALNALEISATTAMAKSVLKTNPPANGNQNGDSDEPMVNERNGSSLAKVTIDDTKEALQSKHIAYDRAGEEHYNLISALHKSMRGSDPDAAIYWLARMLEGGEEPLYIARRLVRFASEDVGLADPMALTQAVACHQACHFLGMPECNVNLAQCVAYLALAPKSIAVYRALGAATKVVKESVGQNEGVPLHLRNAPTKLMKEVGYGKGYIYPPDNPSSSSSQSYLPPSLQGYKFLNWPDSTATDHSKEH